MNLRCIPPTALLLVAAAVASLAQNQPAATEPRWYEVRQAQLEGQGWTTTKRPFDRLPARAEAIVRPPVWSLSHDSAGLCARFETDATWIRIRWTVLRERLALPHMPATGVSGVDLYVRDKNRWHWLAVGRPTNSPENDQTIVRNLSGDLREYLLYFPLYNGVEKLEIGLPQQARFERAPARSPAKRPIVVYGTSIVQGGCASRPGMAYTAIIGRKLDWPVINLGFSGNGKTEPEMAKLLAELDPAAYVLDSLPNLSPSEVAELMEPFVHTLRGAHPRTPIVLVENVPYTDGDFVEPRRKRYTESNALLRALYEKLTRSGDKNILYVPARDLLGDDGEATVDGTHPTDLGFFRMSEAIARVLRPVL
jgi:lysophospholipase L1-like esterase